MTGEEILTTKETAEMLRVSTITLRKLVRDHELPGHKMGRKWVFLKSEIMSWIKNR